MERILVQLDGHQLEQLDALAAARSVSRAAVVRDAVDLLLAVDLKQREIAEVVASYATEPAEDLSVSSQARRAAWPD